MIDKLKELLAKAHEKGIKLPYLRDPLKGTPSVSLTLMIISFFLYILTLVNKLAGWFGETEGSFELLILTTSLYFSRSFSNKQSSSSTEDKK